MSSVGALRSVFLAGLLLPALALGEVIMAGGGVGGLWFNPDRAGEGFFIEVADVAGQPTLVASWFTYDNGDQMWLVGSAAIPDQATSVSVPVSITRGTSFGDAFDAADVDSTPWGTLAFRFPTCNTGVVEYDSALGFDAGSINLVRLTKPVVGVTCDKANTSRSLQAGQWSAEGVCFFVSSDGTKLTSVGSPCGSATGIAFLIQDVFSSGSRSCNISAQFARDIPITDEAFAIPSASGEINVTGSFSSATTGSVTYDNGSCRITYSVVPVPDSG